MENSQSSGLKPTDLIKGCWYYLQNQAADYGWVFRFTECNERGITGSLFACTDKEFTYQGRDFLNSHSRKPYIRLATYDEIYEYFPKEATLHPSALVKGNWYVLKHRDKDYYWVFKFESWEKLSNRIWSRDSATSDGYRDVTFGFITGSDTEYIQPASEELVSKYFPTDDDSEYIKPENMVKGEWYVESDGYMFEFSHIERGEVWCSRAVNMEDGFRTKFIKVIDQEKNIKVLRVATKEEVCKYWPDTTREELPTLEQGKWYVGEIDNRDWLFKFKSFEKENDEQVVSVYKSRGALLCFGEGIMCSFSKLSSINPASYELVKEYFPEEFIQEELEDGKWYQCGNGNWIFKYAGVDDGHILSYKCRFIKGPFSLNEKWNFCEVGKFKDISPAPDELVKEFYPEEFPEPKKIEFVSYLNSDKQWDNKCCPPDCWNKVSLLEKEYANGLDLMWASDRDSEIGCLYLGYYNDGVK